MPKGKLILIEGLEGAGKSTFIAGLQRYLDQHKISHACTREPGGTPIAEAIREVFKAEYCGETMDVKTELLLLYAARNQTMNTVVKPRLQDTDVVLSDRSWLTGYAYQQSATEEDFLRIHNTIMHDAPTADFVIYLDIQPEVGIARARTRAALDRIEKKHLDFFHEARRRYTHIIRTTFSDNHVIVDTTDITQDEVFERVIRHLRENNMV